MSDAANAARITPHPTAVEHLSVLGPSARVVQYLGIAVKKALHIFTGKSQSPSEYQRTRDRPQQHCVRTDDGGVGREVEGR